MDIKNAISVVTGANRGIGRALVEALLERGAARIYATVRDPAQLAPVAALDPKRVRAFQLDVTKREEIARAAREITDANMLINNAGVLASYSLLSSPLTDIEKDLGTNYLGTLAVTRALAPMLEQRRGTIVNLLTVVSLASMPGIGGYSAAKAAAHSMTQALRAELKRRGVSVHGVFPGAVDTDMIRGFDMPKTSARAVADAILAGIERGDEDIFPDPMSQQLHQLFLKSAKDLERQFASM
jgi:NAD(P)-dependent dehydrogenase (short-subunit alcohol dehydrogenase family)